MNLIVLLQEAGYVYMEIYHQHEVMTSMYIIFDNSMMAFLYFITGLAFLVYGSMLTSHLTDASKRDNSCCFHFTSCSVTCRIFSSALLIFVLFILESIVWSLRIPKYPYTTWIELTAINVVSLCVVLILFWKSISSMEEDLAKKSMSHHSRNSSRSPKIAMVRLDSSKQREPPNSGEFDGNTVQSEITPTHLSPDSYLPPDPSQDGGQFGFPESGSADATFGGGLPRPTDPSELHGEF